MCFSTDSRHTYGYKLLFSGRVPLFVWGRLHTWASQEKRKEASPLISCSTIELEIKDTTDTDRSASYLDLHLEIDWVTVKNDEVFNATFSNISERNYDKRDDFNFPIVNFPLISSNIAAASANGVYISQLILYFRACGSYQDFLDRGLLLTRKRLNQGLVDRYRISVSQIMDMFHL